MSALLLMLVGLPAAVGATLGTVHAFAGPERGPEGTRLVDRYAAPVTLATAAVTAVLSVVAVVVRPRFSTAFVHGADFGASIDDLAALVLPTVALVALLVLAVAAVGTHEAPARFHGLMLLFVAAALLTVVADTLVTLLLAWEVMGATSWALIGFTWSESRRVTSGLVAFTVTRAADLGLYLAAGAALAGGAGLALADLPDASTGWRTVLAAGIAVAALGKAAQLPFSFWLARAMDGPSPVSALLHSAAMVAMGGYLLLRIEPTLAATPEVAIVVAWVGALTAAGMGAVAVVQTDLKQLLAASTAAQLGFVVLGAGLLAVDAGAVHLVAHAAVKALLFLVAGAWLTALGTRSLAGLTGAARRWPLLGALAAVGFLALAGVPPLALWTTKDTILAAAREGSDGLYLVGMLAAVLAALYAGKALVLVTRPEPAGVAAYRDDEQTGTGEVPRALLWPLVPLAAGAVVLGLLALPPIGPGVHAGELVLSGVVALVGFGLVVIADRRFDLLAAPGPQPAGGPAWLHGWCHGWFHLERLALVAVARPVDRVARGVAWLDDRVLDRVVDGAAAATLRAGDAVGRSDERVVDGLVDRVAGAVRRAGRWARRPQTGQLHQYYLQSAAALGVALVLLVIVR